MDSSPGTPYVVLTGPDGSRELRLDPGDVWKIGRSSQCTIELKDETISRNHAMIQRAETGEHYFIDLGSQNGSFVNDRRVSTPVALVDNDRISLGRTVITFHHRQQAASNRAPSVGDAGSTRQIFAQRLVTVLVMDIRNYTGLTNTIPQSVLCQVIGSWFRDAERIMQKYGSSVQKYIGDAVMALWVHQKLGQERQDVLGVLRSLLEFAELTTQLSNRFDLPQAVRIGAGVNTGAAAVGSPGSGELTALGDTVNAAFRLETGTKELKTDVVLGQVTFDCLPQIANVTAYFEPHELELKGHTHPVKIWASSFSNLTSFLQQAADKAAISKKNR